MAVNSDMKRHFTVLFVEDEELVRSAVAHMLELHGFDVLIASDGYEAIRLLVEQHVDLLFTDVAMPGLSGFELAAQAKLIRPHIKVLYTSGFADQARGYDGRRFGNLLEKPFRPAQLVAEIQKALPA